MIDQPILITGVPRSGTSMTAGVFHACGAFGGYMKDVSPESKRMTFENVEIRRNICNPFLKSLEMNRDSFPSPEEVNKKITSKFCKEWREKILLKIITQGYDKGRWFYKDSRICFFWQVWANAFPHAIWILVRRDKSEIINSCLKTAYMDNCITEKEWLEWVNQHENCFDAMKRTGLKIHEIYPVNMINGDFSEIEGLIDDLGLDWDRVKVKNFIDFKLCSGNNTSG